jgi:predicted oxidoreductase
MIPKTKPQSRPMMPRTQIAPNSPVFSRMVYGTWRMLDDAPSAQDINRRLHLCLDLGITTIDGAEIYGGYAQEAALGAAMALTPGLRDSLELVTKSGIYVPNPSAPSRRAAHYDVTAKRLTECVDAALMRLGTDRIDLFLIHRPDWLTSIDDTANGLNALVKSGKIRSAGVSNYSPAQYAALNSRMDQPLVTNQVEFSLLHMDPIFDGTFDQMQTDRVQPMAWSPLAGGSLFEGSSAVAQRLAKEAALIAPKYGDASLEQLAYAWVMAHPSKPVPVIGTNRINRIENAAKSVAIALDREDWFGLWVAAKGHGIP